MVFDKDHYSGADCIFAPHINASDAGNRVLAHPPTIPLPSLSLLLSAVRPSVAGAELTGGAVELGSHRTRQRRSGPVCDRLSPSRPVLSLQNRLQAREAILTGPNGPGRVRTVANRAGAALTGAVRTGLHV